MSLHVLSFGGSLWQPKVDLVRGHIPFHDFGEMLSRKYGTEAPDHHRFLYEYAEFGEFQITVMLPGAVATEQKMTIEVLLNMNPCSEKSEPVTIIYYQNRKMSQGLGFKRLDGWLHKDASFTGQR